MKGDLHIVQARIVHQGHPLNGQLSDMLIVDGRIAEMGQKLDSKGARRIEAKGLCVSIGWMDMRANFRDPGDEHKENLESGIRAAAAGGFTAVALSPATEPIIDNKGAVSYLLSKGREGILDVYPIGALSKGMHGKSLSEMYDMYRAGALAFGDDKRSLTESGMLQRALLYTKSFNARILHFPFDAGLAPNGQMHEGEFSTRLGLKGIPGIAEEMVVDRDLAILGYTGGKLHLGPLSSAHSVQRIAEARSSGMDVSCDVGVAHLAYTDTKIGNFDSQYKLMPPLRDASNRDALIAALAEGKIDVISSDHSPADEEEKKLEFDYAAFGTAGIQSFFPLLYTSCGHLLPLEALVARFSTAPRRLCGIELPQIEIGEEANLTLFSIEEESDFSQQACYSRAYNFAERQQKLKGKVIGVVKSAYLLGDQ